MSRSPLDALVTENSLRIMSGRFGNPDLADMPGDQIETSAQIKNVCAKVSSQLADDIDKVVGLLGISKRRFLEAAFLEAVQKAKAIMEAEGVCDFLEARNAPFIDIPANL